MQFLIFGDFSLLYGRASWGMGGKYGLVRRATQCSHGIGFQTLLCLTSYVVSSKSLYSPEPLASDLSSRDNKNHPVYLIPWVLDYKWEKNFKKLNTLCNTQHTIYAQKELASWMLVHYYCNALQNPESRDWVPIWFLPLWANYLISKPHYFYL